MGHLPIGCGDDVTPLYAGPAKRWKLAVLLLEMFEQRDVSCVAERNLPS